MLFRDQLNEYIRALDCTARELSDAAGLSAATLSRYRSGERVPEPGAASFDSLCDAVSRLSGGALSPQAVCDAFLACEDVVSADRESLRLNFNTLVSVLGVNLTRLCRQTNYDVSTLFRIRSGQRRPADPAQFAAAIAGYVSREHTSPADRAVLTELLACDEAALADPDACQELLCAWLLEERPRGQSVTSFLGKLDDFDLNSYIKAIRFDEMKVPSLPFQLPTSRTCTGLAEMMQSELDFLRATVLSRSTAPVILYSDMPMQEMSKDPDFPKKWMYGMAMMLKKGLHLNQIHNLDRSFEDMMLGLESFIPMYMTGQISPYYLPGVQNNPFSHLLKVSGAAALTGEAITGFHADGRYYLTNNKEEVAYYRRRAEQLLKNARPLMDIYRAERTADFRAFLLADARTPGKRRSVLSTPPLYTMEPAFLESLLRRHALPDDRLEHILTHAAQLRQLVEQILQNNPIEDEVPALTPEEFARSPLTLPLASAFLKLDLPYTYADYLAHLDQTRAFARTHPSYTLRTTPTSAFHNLQILLHEGKWAMVSKSRAPAIHFVIRHPKLRKALESFTPPVTEST